MEQFQQAIKGLGDELMNKLFKELDGGSGGGGGVFSSGDEPKVEAKDSQPEA